jgi:3-dehydroquinate dehydratase II
MKISIINGPNLNLLGKRETDIYGQESFEDFLSKLRRLFPGIQLDYFQSNVEGEIINEIQRAGFECEGIILNPGGYTHTSVAIGDAVAAVKAPVIEVHISNIYSREDFRRISFVSPYCKAVISGLGLKGYSLALAYFSDQRDVS